jgi:hypothetical protein
MSAGPLSGAHRVTNRPAADRRKPALTGKANQRARSAAFIAITAEIAVVPAMALSRLAAVTGVSVGRLCV